MWRYQGADGRDAGPFRLQHLRIWLEQGNLYPHLEVSAQARRTSQHLERYLSRDDNSALCVVFVI